MVFVMAAGGTGGHVLPALAVARELRRRGRQAVFLGTRRGLEARLVPQAGFPVEFIEIGALKRVGAGRRLRTLAQLPSGVWRAARLLGKLEAAAVLSLGGYAAGPVALAAWLRGTPLLILEPNAVPGLTNRWMGRAAARVLLNFPEAARYFPAGRTELSGVPVREEFFAIPFKPPGETFEVLVTGGSQGSRTLNEAARRSWPLFRASNFPVRMVLQTGPAAYEPLACEFAGSGIAGQITPFIDDMPAAFARADLVVCRSGAGAVAELAAAGKPALLVPFPYAADQHQLRNAEALVRAGAARMAADAELDGRRLYEEVRELAGQPALLEQMSRAVRSFARPDAARRAADALEAAVRGGAKIPVDRDPLPPEQ